MYIGEGTERERSLEKKGAKREGERKRERGLLRRLGESEREDDNKM